MNKFMIFLEEFITIIASILGIMITWIFAIHTWKELSWVYGILLCLFALLVTAYLIYNYLRHLTK